MKFDQFIFFLFLNSKLDYLILIYMNISIEIKKPHYTDRTQIVRYPKAIK